MRVRWLDVLRAVAVLLVIGRHMPAPAPAVATPVRQVFTAWGSAGWMGVDLFFVLSGFLVSGLLFAEFRRHGQIDLGRFLVRRALKLYPAFWAMIGVTFVWGLQRGDFAPHELRERLGWELLYVQNYNPALWSHTWSLAVEEHFYLGLALLVITLIRRSPATRDPFAALLWVVPVVAALTLAARLATVALAPARPLVGVLYPTHLRVDSLLWGVLLGYLYHFRRGALLAAVRGRLALVLGASIALILPAFVWEVERTPALVTVGLTGLGLGFAGVVLVLLARDEERGGAAGASAWAVHGLAALGVHSYSVYLWHQLVRWWIVAPLWANGAFAIGTPTLSYLALFVSYAAISVTLGVVMARAVEHPVLFMRDRLFPSRSSGPVASATARVAPVGYGASDAMA